MCEDNCSYPNGFCSPGGVCTCVQGFFLNNCLGPPLLPGSEVYDTYQTFRWIAICVSFTLATVSLQRLFALIVWKKMRESSALPSIRLGRCLWFDAQVQIVGLTFLAFTLNCIAWIDFFAVENIFNFGRNHIRLLHVIFVSALASTLIAAARTLHVFISLYARFHPPSRTVARILLGFTAIFVVLWAIGETLAIAEPSQLRNSSDISTYAVSAFVLLLLFGFSLYALTLFRQPRDARVRHSQSEAEVSARAKLVIVVRLQQILCTIAVAFAVWGNFFVNKSVAYSLGYYFGSTVIANLGACAGKCAEVVN